MSPTRRISLIVAALALAAGVVQLALTGHSTLGSDGGFAVTVALLALFVVLDPSQTRQLLTGRRARYGSNAFIMSIAFLGLVAVANAFVGSHGFQLDLTEDQEFTLSPQSVEVVQQLQDDVRAIAFFADDDPGRLIAKNVLQAYAHMSQRFTFEFVDPEKSPDLARQYGVDVFGATIFERGERRQKVTMGASEQNYTGALVRLARDAAKAVYFLSGHEERNFDDESSNGYLAAQQALRREGYDIRPLSLAGVGKVPDDAAALIVAAPAKALLPEEERAISAFVERGGGLLVLADVNLQPPLSEWLKGWGIEFDSNGLVDPTAGLFGDVSTPVITKFEFEPVTGGLAAAFFPGARSLTTRPPNPDVLVTVLGRSSADSWGETDFASRQVNYDAGADLKGPLTLAATIETKTTDVERVTGGKPRIRIVVFGDSDFAANSAFNRLSNGDLFLNAVNWLAHEEVMLAISPRPDRLRRVMLTAQDMRLVFYSSTIFLPAAVLVVAGVVWWRRR